MSFTHYTLHTALFALALSLSLPLAAQKRVIPDEKSAASRLSQTDPKHFTKKDSPRDKDRYGLMSTDYAGNRHLFGLSLSAAYSTILHDMDIVNHTPGGYDFGLGFVYEFQHNYFMLQTGVAASFQGVRYGVEDMSFTNRDMAYSMWGKDSRWLPSGKGGNLVDSRNIPIDMLTYSTSERKDIARTLYLQIPILFGGNINGFYGMAGAKLNLALWGKTHVSQNVTSTADYDIFIGTHEEMDNHGYRKTVPVKADGGQVPFKIDIMASAEIGYEFHRNTVRYRLAAFADYGLLNINPNSADYAFFIPFDKKWNFDQFEMQHAFNSEWTDGKKMHNLFAGIKFTVLFDLPPADKCILCQMNKKRK